MRAVWGKGLLKEKNILLGFQHSFIADESDRLELAASNLYRLFINGELVGYGPARAAHGYSRLDSYSLSAYAGKPVKIGVEVYSANVNTYYTVIETEFVPMNKLLPRHVSYPTLEPVADPNHCYYRIFADGKQIASTVACDLPIENEAAAYTVLSVDQWGNA